MPDYQFVLYLVKNKGEAAYRSAFNKHNKGPRLIVTWHPATSAPAKLGADSHTDVLLNVKSNSPLTAHQVDDMFDAVQAAVRDLGGSMCPVRD
ncbi:hypothetical protein IAT38_000059 [Cryptococcus sp. DSM 104549]